MHKSIKKKNFEVNKKQPIAIATNMYTINSNLVRTDFKRMP